MANTKTEAPWERLDDTSRLLLGLIAEHTNDGIWDLDVATRKVFYSRRYMQLVGYDADELPPHFDTFFSLLHEDDRQAVLKETEDYLNGRKSDYRWEFRLRHKDGSWRWILSRGIAVRGPDGRPLRLAGTHTDITERVREAERLEKVVQERTAELRAARDRAELDAARTMKFLATASHDIRQPLQAMTMLIGGLEREVSSEAGRRNIVALKHSLVASMDMLDALLEFSRVDAGALRPFITTINLDKLIEQVVDAFAPQAESKGIRLSVVPTSATTRSDAQLLARILRNLLSNAIKYTDQGRVLVGCRRTAEGIRIEVWDTGRGIPAAELRKVFWEFYRPKEVTESRSGLGLGLAIVDRLARLLKHRVDVKSWPSRGSVFTIDLPLLSDAAHEPKDDGHEVTPDRSLSGKLIALLEDDQTVALGLTTKLTEWGARVAHGRTTSELIAALGTSSPALLIADRYLGGKVDGFRAFDELERHFGGRLPGLILTGDYDLAGIEAANHGRRRVLQKPVWPAVLYAVLRGEISGTARS
jgi:two-component system, sensor histidine kinase